ncbi:MAG: hypothetical protein V7K57_03905 [Nostoc sp.]
MQPLCICTRTSNSAKISDRLAHHQVVKGLPETGLVVLWGCC